MARESAPALARRVQAVIDRLRTAYPDAHCELLFSNPLELLVATILSAQCSDKQVNLVTRDLFRKYRSASDFANAPLPELEHDIRRIGLFRTKARNIQATCRTLVAQHGGEVPRSLDELVTLAGVGRKTANVVLGTAFGLTSGIVVDTHVARLSRRLGFTRETLPERIEKALGKVVPRECWTLFSHWLIWHGRRRCAARNPDCAHCETRDLCPSATP
ncbi:MAG: endonuclease III [Limisphaerales bacterium]